MVKGLSVLETLILNTVLQDNMDEFETTNLPEGKKSVPWKPVAIVVGAALLVVIIVIGAVLFVRSRQEARLADQLMDRAQSQVERSIETCDQAVNPDACRKQRIGEAAEMIGEIEICDMLEGEDYDGCVWSTARERNRVDFCEAIKDAELAESCSDNLHREAADKSINPDDCELISDENRKAACIQSVSDHIVSEFGCAAAGLDQSICDQENLLEDIARSDDPDRCTELQDSGLVEDCIELIGFGDRDHDGLDEEQERKLGTSDRNVDTDGDGLSDFDEVNVYDSDPTNPDTDGDGFLDGDEVEAEYSPTGPGILIN